MKSSRLEAALPRSVVAWVNLAARRDGGFIYGERARNALAEDFDVEFHDLTAGGPRRRYLKPLHWWKGAMEFPGHPSAWVLDDLYMLALPLPKSGRKIAVVYHDDPSVLRPAVRFAHAAGLERWFYRRLRGLDAIVTISEFWRQHFTRSGFRDVYKIYPGFDLSLFQAPEREVDEFRQRFDLPRPLVYIGNRQWAKGVTVAHEALRDLDVQLVTSGADQVDLPVRNLELSYRDYLLLLKASDVCVTMSLFDEGWCMTAHEAMLLGTPVVGSGRGGMGELLAGGGQVIADAASVREEVARLLADPQGRRDAGGRGRAYAERFTIERFAEDWRALISRVTARPGPAPQASNRPSGTRESLRMPSAERVPAAEGVEYGARE